MNTEQRKLSRPSKPEPPTSKSQPSPDVPVGPRGLAGRIPITITKFHFPASNFTFFRLIPLMQKNEPPRIQHQDNPRLNSPYQTGQASTWIVNSFADLSRHATPGAHSDSRDHLPLHEP